MRHRDINNRGMSIAFAVFTLLVLSVLAAAIFSMLSTDVTGSSEMARGMKVFYIAESGKEIGARAVYDDKLATDSATLNLTDPAANGYCGAGFLEGGYWYGYSGINVLSPENASFHGYYWTYSTPIVAATMAGYQGASLTLWNFQQRYNLMESKLLRIRMVSRLRKQTTVYPDPRLVMQYSTDGGTTWTPDINGDMTGFLIDVTNLDWPTNVAEYNYSIPLSGVTWQNIMDYQNFRIRLYKLDSSKNMVYVDWFALEVVTELDSDTEPWATHSYISLPAALGDGVIDDIRIHDESGKTNINDAPTRSMTYLFIFCKMSSANASKLATDIVKYRNTKKFDTIEELKYGLKLSEANFNLIRSHITVYSWHNKDAQYTGPISPVNINTASENALKAIIKCADLGSDSRVKEIVQRILQQRAISPFINMYSSYECQLINGARDTQTFAGFIESLNYPWLDIYKRLRILALADASAYNITQWTNWYILKQPIAQPFCYSSHTFKLFGSGKIDTLTRLVCATYGNVYNYIAYSWNTKGTFSLPTHIKDTDPQAYWREREGNVLW